jgi:hypothetical protein
MKAKQVQEGRTILTQHGEPVLVAITLRPASSAPSRFKACLAIPDDGRGHETESAQGTPLPFAQAVVTATGQPVPQVIGSNGLPLAWTPEFRIEMN